MSTQHKWTFFRAGGFDQVKLESGEDLMNLENLDQTLWVALACPTGGLEIDPRTLGLIDSDKNGRVRANELIAAVKWAGGCLKRPDDLLKSEHALPLEAIQDATPEGKDLLASARQILFNIGKKNANSLTVEDVSDTARIFEGTAFNGDGVITEVSASDEPARAVIRDIMECIGNVPDLSGRPGIGAAEIEAFFTEAKAFRDWQVQAISANGRVFPLGMEKTAAAVSAMTAIRPKVDDYFGRCRLAAYDPRTEKIMNRQEEEYLSIAAQDLSITAAEVAAFPLAQAAADRPLPLKGAVNPAHAAALGKMAEAAVTPLLGARERLTEAEWMHLLAKVEPFQAWEAGKTGLRVERLGMQRIEEILATDQESVLVDLLARDKALEVETAGIEKIERLVRFYRDLSLLCTNFVNFQDFYDREKTSIFQCGTLYLDQRACRLCLPVEDPVKHASMAGLAGAYLAYCDCARKGTGEKMQIVAAFTAGDSDNLMVGRNGVFYDRKGLDWDATIVKIVDNPISISQAFWSPYKKFVRYLEEQVSKRAAAADALADKALATTAATAVNADTAKPAPVKNLDVGTVAAIGVAFGAIGTFFTALIGYGAGIFKMGMFATVGAILGLVLLISLPSVVMAYIKLRKRNLGPILDANGWAVNAKARINVPFGGTLSRVAKLPPGSRRDSSDPYAEKVYPWKQVALIFLIVYGVFQWYAGAFDAVLPGPAKSTSILGQWAPRALPGAPPGGAR